MIFELFNFYIFLVQVQPWDFFFNETTGTSADALQQVASASVVSTAFLGGIEYISPDDFAKGVHRFMHRVLKRDTLYFLAEGDQR